jgi:hypothetical protein
VSLDANGALALLRKAQGEGPESEVAAKVLAMMLKTGGLVVVPTAEFEALRARSKTCDMALAAMNDYKAYAETLKTTNELHGTLRETLVKAAVGVAMVTFVIGLGIGLAFAH